MGKEEVFLCPFCGAPYRELIPAGTVQVKCRYCGATVLVPPRLGGAVQRCQNHPGTLAVRICDDCGKSYCGDCLFVVSVTRSAQAPRGYYNYCAGCLQKRKTRDETVGIFFSVFFFLMGLIIGVVELSLYPPLALFSLFFIGLGIMPFFFSNPYKITPTVNMLIDKLSELNRRAERVRAAMSPQEAETYALPNISDALSELKKEMKEAELAKLKKE